MLLRWMANALWYTTWVVAETFMSLSQLSDMKMVRGELLRLI